MQSHGTAHVLHSVNMAEPSMSPHVMKLLLKRLPVYLMLYNYLEISTIFPLFYLPGFSGFLVKFRIVVGTNYPLFSVFKTVHSELS